jgi:ubiquinone/menaquinone biosynthesis C-methylase UbiE
MHDKFSDLNLDASLADQIRFEGQDVLEVGSGSGGFTLKYLTSANSILAIDPDSEAMAELQAQWRPQTENIAKINFLCESITDVSLPGNSFDIGVFSNSF